QPTNVDDQKRQRPADDLIAGQPTVQPFAGPAQHGAVIGANGQAQPVIQAPDQKVPRRPVPQPAQGEGKQPVETFAYHAVPAAPNGDVDVIADPAAQRDVPAAPEVGQVGGQIRPIEVCRQAHTEHPG